MRFRTSAHVALGILSLCLVNCGGEATPEPESPTPASLVTPEPEPAPAATTTAEPTTPPASTTPDQPAMAEPVPKVEPLSDDQIATITDTANTAEVDQAKIAQGKAKNARVKKFAAMMIADHTQAKQKQAKLKLSTQESPLSTQLGVENSSTLSTLKSSTGPDFDRAYMSAQVEAHRKVLDAIDTRLLPNVKNPELKALLEEVRPKIEKHLKEAEEIQQSLSAAPGVDQGQMKGGTGTDKTGGESGMNKPNPGGTGTGTSSPTSKGTSSGTGTGTSKTPPAPGTPGGTK